MAIGGNGVLAAVDDGFKNVLPSIETFMKYSQIPAMNAVDTLTRGMTLTHSYSSSCISEAFFDAREYASDGDNGQYRDGGQNSKRLVLGCVIPHPDCHIAWTNSHNLGPTFLVTHCTARTTAEAAATTTTISPRTMRR